MYLILMIYFIKRKTKKIQKQSKKKLTFKNIYSTSTFINKEVDGRHLCLY